LEYWNVGFCGILFFKIKFFHFDTHCSIIPWALQMLGLAKRPMISIGCRISETSN
jgi:hypothetical protein